MRLSTDSLRHSIRHRAVVKGANQPPFAVHGEITRRPDRRGAHITGEYRIIIRQLTDFLRQILRVDQFPFAGGCQCIEVTAGGLIVFQRRIQMGAILFGL